MKVLRTALFSAFLMICFMNIGHAQRSGTPVHLDDSNANGLKIQNVVATHFITGNFGFANVTYDVTSTLPNSVTEIIDESDGRVLFSQNVGTGTINEFGGVSYNGETTISTNVAPNLSNGFAMIECRVYNQEAGESASAVCVVTIETDDIDDQTLGGGN